MDQEQRPFSGWHGRDTPHGAPTNDSVRAADGLFASGTRSLVRREEPVHNTDSFHRQQLLQLLSGALAHTCRSTRFEAHAQDRHAASADGQHNCCTRGSSGQPFVNQHGTEKEIVLRTQPVAACSSAGGSAANPPALAKLRMRRKITGHFSAKKKCDRKSNHRFSGRHIRN